MSRNKRRVHRLRPGRFGYKVILSHLLGFAPHLHDQNAALQLDALARAGCYRSVVDVASDSLDERPDLAKVLISSGPGTPWRCGAWIVSGGRCAISSTPWRR